MRHRVVSSCLPLEAKSVHRVPKMWVCVANVMGVASACTKDIERYPKDERNPYHLECGWMEGIPHGS